MQKPILYFILALLSAVFTISIAAYHSKAAFETTSFIHSQKQIDTLPDKPSIKSDSAVVIKDTTQTVASLDHNGNDTIAFQVTQSEKSCYRIAKRFNISLNQLLELNPDLDCNLLRPNVTVVKIPVRNSQWRTKGMTADSIAKLFNISAEVLLRANPFLQKDSLISLPDTSILIPLPK